MLLLHSHSVSASREGTEEAEYSGGWSSSSSCKFQASSSGMQGGHGYGHYGYGGGYGYDASGGGYGYGYDAGGGYSSYDAGGYYSTGGYPSAPGYEDPHATGYPVPLNGLEFQPSEACPNNYVIFDQTCTRSRVMFHPSLPNRLGGYGGGACNGDALGAAAGKGGAYRDPVNDVNDDGSCSVRQKEDTEEIDALMSSEDGDEDDLLSTGRTPGYRDGSSPDSACSSGKPRGKDRVKKMMRTLKGIIPGGNQMDTPAVLDEAVRYLKSLKVEAKKLGVRGSDR